MKNLQYNWYFYKDCYVFIETKNSIHFASIYGVNDESYVESDTSMDKLLEKSRNMIDQYLKPYNFIDKARKIPDFLYGNFIRQLNMENSIITKDRVVFNNAFKKYGYKKALDFAFHGVCLWNVRRSGMLDLSGFMRPNKELRLNKKLVILSGFQSNYILSFKINSFDSVIEATHDRNRDLLRIEFDSDAVRYGNKYEFILYIDGVMVDNGYMILTNCDFYIECEFVGCDRLFNKMQRKFSVSLKDDFNTLNMLIPGPSVVYNESSYEVLKCQISSFIRFCILVGADECQVKNYIEKFNFPYLIQFFNSYAFEYEDIKDMDSIYVDYSVPVNEMFKNSKNNVGAFFVKTVLNLEHVKFDQETYGIFYPYLSEYKLIGKNLNVPDKIISIFKLCWEYKLSDSIKDRVYLYIIKKIVDKNYNTYEDICIGLGEIVSNYDDIAEAFNMSNGYDSYNKKITHPSQFINKCLSEIEAIAIRENLPLLSRKKGTAQSKTKS